MASLMAWFPLITAGLLAGLLAGLFGVGGGVVVVPAVYAAMIATGVSPDLAMKIALGTSLASIIVTGSTSALRHQTRNAVDWHLVAALSPGLVIGAGTAGLIAHLAPGEWLRTGFAVFLLLVAALILRQRASDETEGRRCPAAVALLSIGLIFGLVSGLAGVGGGTLVVPFLVWAGFSMVLSVGTASACGVAIALAGTIGYVVSGWGSAELPPYALGYVYLPALVAVIAGSVVAAPIGVWAAHRLPPRPLKLGFAAMLVSFSAAILLYG
jgi:uncharacterized protein